jgi:hypothetical protein
MTRLLRVVLLCAPAIGAQTFSFGAKAGLVKTGSAMSAVRQESKPYLLGPAVEFKLPAGLALEASALYSRFGESLRSETGEIGIGPIFKRVRANSWEFPIVAKRYLSEDRHGIRPFVSGGYALRRVSLGEYSLSVYTGGSLTLLKVPEPRNPTHGATASAGFQIPFGRLKIAPELRYTRWVTAPAVTDVLERKNTVGLLAGFTF